MGEGISTSIIQEKCEEAAVKQLICVSLSAAGEPAKQMDVSLVELRPLIEGSLITWVNCAVEDVSRDADKVAAALGFEEVLVPSLLTGFYAQYEDLETSLGLLLPAVTVSKFDVEINPLLVLLRKNLIVTIHSEKIKRLVRLSRYAEIFLKKIPLDMQWNDRMTVLLQRIIYENNEKNFEGLRSIEEQGDEMGRLLLDPNTPRTQLAAGIYNMKHALITYLNVLWATLDVISSLRYGDAELITDDPKLLEKFDLLHEDITRQIALTEHMSEVLASGLEVLQSIYNNQLQILNNRMAMVITWLTVLGTAVLVPNTIATIFGSLGAVSASNINAYLALLVASTAAATWLAYFWIKRKGWLPARVD